MTVVVFEWTPESINRAAELWNEGKSASEVGRVIGVSRCSISGIVNRHRDLFVKKGSGFRSDAMKKEKPEAKKARTIKPNRNSGFFHPRAKPEADPVLVVTKADAKAYDEARAPFLKPLHELTSCQCHWPLNDGKPFLFCAAATEAGKTYCDHHHRRLVANPIQEAREA